METLTQEQIDNLVHETIEQLATLVVACNIECAVGSIKDGMIKPTEFSNYGANPETVSLVMGNLDIPERVAQLVQERQSSVDITTYI